MLRKVAALVIFLIVMVPAGCSLLSHEAPSEDIDKAAALFFQRLGNEDYATIYNDCAKGFKDSQTKQTVTESLKQMAEHGKILDFQRISMTFQGEGKSRIALPVYRTSSAQARAEITLTFQDEGGEWKLFGFAYKPRA
jgi:hypothetical protein